ncbi:MAG: replicative DNA helicase [Firmicutes bacterium]|nr:replicative DNA helicase [Bacillota bacterium]
MDIPINENPYLNKIPPHSLEAERAVLASVFIDPDAIVIAAELLRPEYFYNPGHKAVFDAALELFGNGSPIDVVTVKEKLSERGIFEELGGMGFLSSIASAAGSSANVADYAKIVEGRAVLRNLISAANEISTESFRASEEVEAILDRSEKAIFDISQKRQSQSFRSIREISADVFEHIEDMYQKGSRITGVPTGFSDFDSRTAGLQPSDLILIAARPSMGKTAFALNIAQHAAIRHNVPVAIFSLEMSREQLVSRVLCSEAMLDSQRLRTGNLEDEDWTKLTRALGPVSEAPIYIDDTPGITPMELRAKARRLKAEKDIGLIIIDYLQLMSSSRGRDNRQQEISEISRELKAVAREMNVPLIALSQLSRACEQRADKRPMLSDLRESGAIEQDADIVAFLYRDEYYYPESEKKNMAELIIAKQRNGPTGTIELTWMSNYTRFAGIARVF